MGYRGNSDVGLIEHLMRRSGFGATRDQLDAYAAKGYKATVEELLDPHSVFVMKLRGQATLSKWAEEYLRANVEEAEARARANLDPEIEYFVADPHEESSHIEKYFWSPVAVKLDGAGTLFVTESNRHRIQLYRRGT